MRRLAFRSLLLLLTIGFVGVLALPPTAHAAAAPLTARGHRQPAVTPLPPPASNALDVDILIQTADGTLPVSGYLHLALVSGTAYKGTFVDNQADGGVYTATATLDSTSGNLSATTINTHVGQFTFDAQGNATAVPKKLGSAAGAGLALVATHAYSTKTYTFTIAPALGIAPNMAGKLVLTHDANQSLVNTKTGSAVSTLTTTSHGRSITIPLTSGGIFDPTPVTGSLETTVKFEGVYYALYGLADNTGVFNGPLIAGTTGPKAAYATFVATPSA